MSRMVSRIITKAQLRANERGRGIPPTMMRFSTGRTLETTVPDAGRLPCIYTENIEPELQDAYGNLLPLAGYSVGY